MTNRLDTLIETVRSLHAQRVEAKERARVAYLADLDRVDADFVPQIKAAMLELSTQHGLNKTALGEVYGTKNRKTILDILGWGGPTAAPRPAAAVRRAAHENTEPFSLDSDGRVVVNWDDKTAVSDRTRLNVTGDPVLKARLVTETADTDDLVKEFEAWISRN